MFLYVGSYGQLHVPGPQVKVEIAAQRWDQTLNEFKRQTRILVHDQQRPAFRFRSNKISTKAFSFDVATGLVKGKGREVHETLLSAEASFNN